MSRLREVEDTYLPWHELEERMAVFRGELYADDPPLAGPPPLTPLVDLVDTVQHLLDLGEVSEHPDLLEAWCERWDREPFRMPAVEPGRCA